MRPILLVLLLVLPGALLYPAAGAPVLPLGDCASETTLAGRTDIVFREPWERQVFGLTMGFSATAAGGWATDACATGGWATSGGAAAV